MIKPEKKSIKVIEGTKIVKWVIERQRVVPNVIEREVLAYAGLKIEIDKKTGCWNCIERLATGDGYITVKRNDEHGAHRVSYKYAYGEIPKGKSILHKCDNKICINPEHLFVGSLKDNIADMVSKDRQAKGTKINTNILTEEQVIEILKDNTSLHTELAEKYGVTKHAIFRIRKRLNWKHVSLPEGFKPYITPSRAKSRSGENHGCCKLTDKQIDEIRNNLTDNQYQLAERYEISQAHIWRIKHNMSRINN